jgi:hypothetical protein
MNVKAPITCLLLATAMFSACKPNGNNTISGGGKGGNTVLRVIPEHHGGFVDSCTIYIKYGATDAPANGLYDDSSRCRLSDTTPIATFTGLKTGLYYLFGAGYHIGYNPPQVKGGLPCTISNSDTLTIYLPTFSY